LVFKKNAYFSQKIGEKSKKIVIVTLVFQTYIFSNGQTFCDFKVSFPTF
jgi:hypothetical protein